MVKYIHIERLKVLANISYCFILCAFTAKKQRATGGIQSTVVNSRLSHRYMPAITCLGDHVGFCISQIETGIQITIGMISAFAYVLTIRKFQVFLDTAARMAGLA